jgi:RecJ-like exonuclease
MFSCRKKKMDNQDVHLDLDKPADENQEVTQEESVVEEPKEVENQEEVTEEQSEAVEKSGNVCADCSGTGLINANTLCKVCNGSGRL